MTMQALAQVRVAVVGVDGSSASRAAMMWASRAVGPGGTIHAVHTVKPSNAAEATAPPTDRVSAVSKARAHLANWVDDLTAPGVQVVLHVLEEDTSPAILAMAADTDADLIAVGTHTGILPFRVLGHVPATLVRSTRLPITLVGANAASASACGVGSRAESDAGGGVVVGVGRGESTASAIEWATAFARQHGWAIALVRALPDRPAFGPDGMLDVIAHFLNPAVLETWAAEDLAELAAQIEEAADDEVAITWAVRRGAVGRRLVEAAAGAELLVIGRHDGFGDPSKSRTLHHSLLHSPCPIAVIPTDRGEAATRSKPTPR